MSRAIATTDHQAIRQWIEARNGHPSVVKSTESSSPGKAGLLRVDFNKPEEGLEEVSWDDFFETFDENQLAFLYQEETASGRKSRFNKFVSRDSVDTQDTEENSIGASDEGGSSRRSASAVEAEADEIDEEDALEEDEDMQDDEDEER